MAALGPAEGIVRMRPLAELRGIVKTLPRLDRGESFAGDVLASVKAKPPLPESHGRE